MMNKKDIDIITGYVDELEEDDKRIVMMHIINDMHIDDIADVLGYNNITVSEYLNNALTILTNKITSYNQELSSSDIIPYLKSIYNEYENNIEIDKGLSDILVKHISNDTLQYLEVKKHVKQGLITHDVVKNAVKFFMGLFVTICALFAFHNVVDLEEDKSDLEKVQSYYSYYTKAEDRFFLEYNKKHIDDLYEKAKKNNDINLEEYEKYLISDDAILYREYLFINDGFIPTDFILEDFNHDGVRDLLMIYNMDRENGFYKADDAVGILKEMEIRHYTFYRLVTINPQNQVVPVYEWRFDHEQYSYTYDFSFVDNKIYIVRKIGHLGMNYDGIHSLDFHTKKEVYIYTDNTVSLLEEYQSEEVDYECEDMLEGLIDYKSTYDKSKIIKLEDIR